MAAALTACVLASPGTASADPVIAAAGDIACDPDNPAYNGGAGTVDQCRQRGTGELLGQLAPDAVLMLGDGQYPAGAYADYMSSYDPTWGQMKAATRPTPGNHEYKTPGALGYYQYFGPAAGDPALGWYSYDLGAWHIVALNSNCGAVGGCAAGSPQEQWLRADLAAHPADCTLAYWHAPVFSSGPHGTEAAAANTTPLWDALYQAGADVILNGHDHDYERFAPQTPDGIADPERGIREFVVGTGGASHYSLKALKANSEVFDNHAFGVLVLTLHATGYDWRFVAESGGSFTDTGSGDCHMAPRNTVRPAVSGTPEDGQALAADTGTWVANPPAQYSYQWRRCDLLAIRCTSIDGATDPSYRLTAADVGSRIRVRVYATNAAGTAYAPSNATLLVLAAVFADPLAAASL